ncbi:MAG: hypothetical protein P8100_01630 [bacterium]
MAANLNGSGLEELNNRLNELESRIAQLEKGMIGQTSENVDVGEELNIKPLKDLSEGLFSESRIGETGLAWLGNVVLFLGITFFEQYIDNAGHHIVSALFGYISVAGIFTLSHFLRVNYSKMAFIFNLNAYVLLFYVTLRMHFFTAVPVVANAYLALVLLGLVAAVQLIIALRKRSVILTGMNIFLLAIIALLSDNTHILFPVLLVSASLAVSYLFRFGWKVLFQLSIILTYLVTLLWFLNNPLMGNQMQAIQEHSSGYVYLFLLAIIYSIATFAKNEESVSNTTLTTSIVLNGSGFSIIFALVVVTFFKDNYVLMVGTVAALSLIFSVVLQLRTARRTPPALYALYGFVMMSIAVYGIYGFPEAYFLLAIQSLLVVSIAIWFRSKFIVGMNAILFVILLAVYSRTAELINEVNISFTLAAFVTARILNWKKERLTIKTEALRNIYLFLGFVMMLITLYYLIPDRYITLSWVVAGLVYFLLSIILKNVKYRWMALGTLGAAAVYLFIVDLARIELVYRVIALMFLAIISIGLSIFYARRSRNKPQEES